MRVGEMKYTVRPPPYLQKFCTIFEISRGEILAWLPVTAGSICGFLSDEWKKQLRHLFSSDL